MKQKKKKTLALMLVVLLLTGCGISPKNSTASNQETIIYPDTTEAKPLTIGYTFWDVTFNDFAIAQANQIKLVAKALGVNLIFNPDNTDFSSNSVVNAARTFAEQDVDGMVVVNFSEESLVEISNICEENQIPFIQATRTINDSSVADVVEANPYYVGRIHENEYAAAYEVGRNIIEQGSKNILLLCPEHGDVAYEARAEGFRDACEEPDVKIIDEVWDLQDDEQTTEIIKDLLVNHPEADAIFSIRAGFFSGAMEAQKQLGYENYLSMGGIDFDNTLGECYKTNAKVTVAGGHHADASLSLITLVNAIRGAYDESLFPIDINNSMLIIDSLEEFNDYNDWCLGFDIDLDNRQILNANDARGLCIDYNPEAKLMDIITFAENVSITSVKARHSYFVNN